MVVQWTCSSMRAGLRLLPPEHRSPRTSNTARCVRGLIELSGQAILCRVYKTPRWVPENIQVWKAVPTSLPGSHWEPPPNPCCDDRKYGLGLGSLPEARGWAQGCRGGSLSQGLSPLRFCTCPLLSHREGKSWSFGLPCLNHAHKHSNVLIAN